MDIKIRRRLAMLHAMLGSSHAGERENSWAKIKEILREHGRRRGSRQGLSRSSALQRLLVSICSSRSTST
jgi:hypothetical protein